MPTTTTRTRPRPRLTKEAANCIGYAKPWSSRIGETRFAARSTKAVQETRRVAPRTVHRKSVISTAPNRNSVASTSSAYTRPNPKSSTTTTPLKRTNSGNSNKSRPAKPTRPAPSIPCSRVHTPTPTPTPTSFGGGGGGDGSALRTVTRSGSPTSSISSVITVPRLIGKTSFTHPVLVLPVKMPNANANAIKPNARNDNAPSINVNTRLALSSASTNNAVSGSGMGSASRLFSASRDVPRPPSAASSIMTVPRGVKASPTPRTPNTPNASSINTRISSTDVAISSLSVEPSASVRVTRSPSVVASSFMTVPRGVKTSPPPMTRDASSINTKVALSNASTDGRVSRSNTKPARASLSASRNVIRPASVITVPSGMNTPLTPRTPIADAIKPHVLDASSLTPSSANTNDTPSSSSMKSTRPSFSTSRSNIRPMPSSISMTSVKTAPPGVKTALVSRTPNVRNDASSLSPSSASTNNAISSSTGKSARASMSASSYVKRPASSLSAISAMTVPRVVKSSMHVPLIPKANTIKPNVPNTSNTNMKTSLLDMNMKNAGLGRVLSSDDVASRSAASIPTKRVSSSRVSTAAAVPTARPRSIVNADARTRVASLQTAARRKSMNVDPDRRKSVNRKSVASMELKKKKSMDGGLGAKGVSRDVNVDVTKRPVSMAVLPKARRPLSIASGKDVGSATVKRKSAVVAEKPMVPRARLRASMGKPPSRPVSSVRPISTAVTPGRRRKPVSSSAAPSLKGGVGAGGKSTPASAPCTPHASPPPAANNGTAVSEPTPLSPKTASESESESPSESSPSPLFDRRTPSSGESGEETSPPTTPCVSPSPSTPLSSPTPSTPTPAPTSSPANQDEMKIPSLLFPSQRFSNRPKPPDRPAPLPPPPEATQTKVTVTRPKPIRTQSAPATSKKAASGAGGAPKRPKAKERSMTIPRLNLNASAPSTRRMHSSDPTPPTTALSFAAVYYPDEGLSGYLGEDLLRDAMRTPGPFGTHAPVTSAGQAGVPRAARPDAWHDDKPRHAGGEVEIRDFSLPPTPFFALLDALPPCSVRPVEVEAQAVPRPRPRERRSSMTALPNSRDARVFSSFGVLVGGGGGDDDVVGGDDGESVARCTFVDFLGRAGKKKEGEQDASASVKGRDSVISCPSSPSLSSGSESEISPPSSLRVEHHAGGRGDGYAAESYLLDYGLELEIRRWEERRSRHILVPDDDDAEEEEEEEEQSGKWVPQRCPACDGDEGKEEDGEEDEGFYEASWYSRPLANLMGGVGAGVGVNARKDSDGGAWVDEELILPSRFSVSTTATSNHVEMGHGGGNARDPPVPFGTWMKSRFNRNLRSSPPPLPSTPKKTPKKKSSTSSPIPRSSPSPVPKTKASTTQSNAVVRSNVVGMAMASPTKRTIQGLVKLASMKKMKTVQCGKSVKCKRGLGVEVGLRNGWVWVEVSR